MLTLTAHWAPVLAATGGSMILGARMLAWSKQRHDTPMTPEQIVDAAPIALRPAVLAFADPLQTLRLFRDLGLGSAQSEFPTVDGWDYAPHGITVDALLAGGQTLHDWANPTTCEAMAHALGAERVVVSSPAPGWVRLQVHVADTLADPIPAPLAVVDGGAVDVSAVPVGVCEDGTLWRLQLLGSHILLAGATGSGKGSVLWSILAGVGPAIRSGLVDVWLADPKGGAEFGRGENRLFTRFAVDVPTILAVLTEAVDVMQQRLSRMRAAGVRKTIPTTDEPLIVVVIDEAAALSSYADREEQALFRRLTGLLLSQGRAAAVSVIAALQDPSKETMPNRQLFPTRIGLRLDEPTQVAMVHGAAAVDRGARCHEIPATTPGVGYVGEDGHTGFTRVRAFWVPDESVDAIVDAYGPQPVTYTAPTSLPPVGFDPDDLGDEAA